MFPILAIPTALALWRMLKKDETYKLGDRIPSEFVMAIIKNNVDVNCHIWLTDEWYYPPTDETMQKFVEDYKKFMDYMDNNWDCDNIATDGYVMCERKMPGCAVGFLEYEKVEECHELNFYINPIGAFKIMDLGSKIVSAKPKDIKETNVYI